MHINPAIQFDCSEFKQRGRNVVGNSLSTTSSYRSSTVWSAFYANKRTHIIWPSSSVSGCIHT